MNALTWDLPTHGEVAEPDAEAVLAEINGYHWESKVPVKDYEELRADGSTACGCWIYSGVMPESGKNVANLRESKDQLGHGWAFAWPKDIRILYNRASAKPDGTPWSERKKLVWWDREKKQWTGNDNSDCKKTMPPDHKGEPEKGGLEALDGDKPFGMHPDGRGWLYVSSGLKDGPLPAHFEPLDRRCTTRSIQSTRPIHPPTRKSARTISMRNPRAIHDSHMCSAPIG